MAPPYSSLSARLRRPIQPHVDTSNGHGVDHSKIQRPVGRRLGQGVGGNRMWPRGPLAFFRPNTAYTDWSEVTIRIHGINSETTTYDLQRSFMEHGNIIHIQIFQNRDGSRDTKGLIRFSPPPETPFWEDLDKFQNYTIKLDNALCYNARIFLDESRGRQGPLKIQSPIRKSIFYPAKMKLIPSSLKFGVMEAPQSFMPMKTIMASPAHPISLEVNLQKLKITATFHVEFIDPRTQGDTDIISNTAVSEYHRITQYSFEIPFASLKTIYRSNNGTSSFALVISLDDPPVFYRKRENVKATHSDEGLEWSERDTWYRATDIVYDPYRLRAMPVELHMEKTVIDIGRWTTYRFEILPMQNKMDDYNDIKRALADFNIEILTREDCTEVPPRASDVWALVDHCPPKQGAAELDHLSGGEGTVFLPFEVRYQLEVSMSRNILSEVNITKEFVGKLAGMAAEDPCKAKYILEYVVEQGKRVWNPMTIFDDEMALTFSPKTEIPHYCAFVRKVTVSPTTTYFSTPNPETTNRVLRRYARENMDGRFLRVQFTDELAKGAIQHNANKQVDDEVYTRVFRTLYNGIRIGDRRYQFLAFGNSQFRENGAYFFCPTEHLSCEDIRDWMGNFSHIMVVAKYAARLGQCFSTTRAVNGLSAPEIRPILDIKKKYGGAEYCFTDGVGKLSPFLAQIITADLNLRLPFAPSAFQFRLGGCKGILVVSPDAKGREVHIRKSQQKFTAVYNGLEIIRWSRFSAATLNRQTITLLSSLGVPDQVFVKMLTEQLENYHIAMTDNDLAQNMLTKHIDDAQMTINIATMINNGFMAEHEPFVLSLLQLWRAWSIKQLKEKARIVVENGAFLLGCVDETETLRGYVKPTVAPGEKYTLDELPQVFVQIPVNVKEDPTKYQVLEGICIVGRNPSLHPGDLRVVQAIDVPALHHLRDVLVFPQQGERDVPSMCSGGDLDGDDYFVIWDRELMPAEWNAEPMNYQPPAPMEQSQPVRITDLMKFFVRYMKNDALGTIAHAHLANSDWLDVGPKHPVCLELANLHSKAVDYVKTGQPAEMPKRLRAPKWPHFMEKRHAPKDRIYHSYKVLGQLYDKVESIDFKPKYDGPFDKRILRAYKLDDSLLKKVRQTKTQYDISMKRIMSQQEIATEFEVWSTFVLSKPRVGTDYKQQEVMAQISGALKERYRAICTEVAGGSNFSVLGPFVAGMYKVTKEELDIALAECRSTKIINGRTVPKRTMEPKFMPLISFPWLFEKELARIATGIDASDEYDGLPAMLDVKAQSSRQKRAQGGDLIDMEDFIHLEDGKTIHRGQELDLFFPSNDEEFFDNSDLDEARSIRDFRDTYHMTKGESGETVLQTAFRPTAVPEHMLSGTGIEDVVPWTELDGLIDPRERASADHENSASSGLAVPNHNHNSEFNSNRLSGSYADLAELDHSSPPSDGVMVEEEVYIDVKESALEKLARMMNGAGLSTDNENAEPEEEIVEEEVHVEVKESALEKLARLMES